jgi:hypothetical protein
LRAASLTAALFTLTLFVSAALLFVVQPLFARMVLPLLGGTPAVWNTCMVFFQAVLLAGYAYADAAPARLGARRQAALHLGLLLLPWLVLPIAIPAYWPPPDALHPAVWLLGLLAVAVGLPFFVVSTSGPLLQRWFAGTAHPAARDPYFLYAASNLGSMLGLLSYPFVLEPSLTLSWQSRLWAAGYAALCVLTAGCAAVVLRSRPAPAPAPKAAPAPQTPPPLTAGRRARWVLLAFVPSSLLLSVTTYLTTDIAAIPLLWVLPLALYLLTFILVFARRRLVPAWFWRRSMPLVVLLVVLALLSEATEPLALVIGLHLLGLFWVGMVCHGLLAEDRPPAARLTTFYLCLSLGGVLGGLFNALVAPLLFPTVLEYPLVLVLACLLRPGAAKPAADAPGRRRLDVLLPAAVGAGTAALVLAAQASGLEPGPASVAVMFAAPLVVCYTFLERPVRFGLGVGALLLAGSLYRGVHGTPLHLTRSFFGVHRVTLSPSKAFRELVHGNTVHGRQSTDPARARAALTYYHRTGPAGRLMTALRGDPRLRRVGLVGLGAGSLATYAEGGQHWTYFEIDPAVSAIADDPRWFTFCRDARARGVDLDVVLGDARLTLARSPDRFGVLVVDAFSSDAIPVHLLTREALRVYRAHLDDDGVLAFHLSNRYLDLEPVLAELAADADPPLRGYVWDDRVVGQAEKEEGKLPSVWVILARDGARLGPVVSADPWVPLHRRPGLAVWTDDYSNLISVFSARPTD